MKATYEHIFYFSKQFLLEQYTSQAFYEARMAQDGIEDAKVVSFIEKGSETIIKIDREVEIRTQSAPRFIQKIADRFVGDAAILSTQISWNKNKAFGTNVIQAKGVPVSVTITLKIIETSDNQASIKAELDIRANIPLVGKQLEKFVLPKAEKVMKKDFEKAEAYFKSL